MKKSETDNFHRLNRPTNLVFIEGAPAVGKKTVAIELAKLTGFRAFHNHLSQDLAGAIHPEWSQPRFDLVDKIRHVAFKDAAENGSDLIFTYVYGGYPNENRFLADTVHTFEDNGGEVRFVKLFADSNVQENRVDDESRKEFQKINDIHSLRHRMAEYAINPEFPYAFEVSLDTTTTSPTRNAQLINDLLQLV